MQSSSRELELSFTPSAPIKVARNESRIPSMKHNFTFLQNTFNLVL